MTTFLLTNKQCGKQNEQGWEKHQVLVDSQTLFLPQYFDGINNKDGNKDNDEDKMLHVHNDEEDKVGMKLDLESQVKKDAILFIFLYNYKPSTKNNKNCG